MQRGFRFGISFYLIAMLFILFDVEVIFLYPVAVHLKAAGTFVLVEIADLRRAARGRLRVRVAPGSARVEVKREKARGSRRGAASAEELRARQLRARDMLRGVDLSGADLDKYVEERVLTTTLEKALNWAPRRTRSGRPPSASPAARSR